MLTKNYCKISFGIFFILTSFFCSTAIAEFVSVKTKKATLFEGPSSITKRLFVVTEGYPLKIIVSLKDWKKVKDHKGKISWIEVGQIDQSRTLMTIKENVNLYHKASFNSPKLGEISKFVILDLNSALIMDGWVKVQSQLEGVVGYLRADEVWGL
jgi:SH3 domain protein